MGMRADPTISGAAALADGDWPGARAAFEVALVESDAPESHLGLGRALWWMQDVDGALFQVEEAFAGFRSLTFEDAGEHELKGVPDRWRLYRAVLG